MKHLTTKQILTAILVVINMICGVGFTMETSAQVKINCHITTDGAQFISADVSVADSLGNSIYSSIIKDTDFGLSLPAKGLYKFSLSSVGFNDWEREFRIANDTTLNIKLLPNTKILQEVTVQAVRSSKVTATGEIFKLSAKAKASGDPYIALSEIPTLDVNIATQTVTTQDGSTPLVLIDGKYLNSGINPIDPKFIESVEVVEVTNAKYLEMGVSKILNIKLKRDVPFYSFVNGRTRHDIPIAYGFAGANFEFGTNRIAISGNLFGHYNHHVKTDFSSEERMGDYFKTKQGQNALNELMWEGYLMLKWTPNSSNYFSAIVKTRDSHGKTSGEASGNYNSLTAENLSAITHNHTVDGGTLAAAFYEHTFANKDRLSSYFHYNRGFYDQENSNEETITDTEDYAESDIYYESLNSVRDQFVFNVDYDSSTHKFGEISAGNKYEYTKDRQENMAVNPHDHLSLVRQNNYTYFSYSYSWRKIFLMASAGLQYMNISTMTDDNDWWRPRASAAVTFILPKDQNIRASYIMNNSLPQSSYLQTFNTSVDPWVRIEGNPYLVPVRLSTASINYRKKIKRQQVNLYGTYRTNKDMIESYIINEDGVSVHTYRNYGSYESWTLGTNITLMFGKVSIRPYASWSSERYKDMESMQSVSAGGSLRWDFGKFFFYTKVDWRNRRYTPYSVTRYKNPYNSLIQLTWTPTKQWQLTLGMYNYTGVKRQVTVTQKGDYYRMSDYKYKGASLHPWILISWTMRKNAKYKIKDKMPTMDM